MDKIRILICKTCPSVQELPYYEGPPQHDDWLNRYVNQHGPEHIGQLATVNIRDWQDGARREAITKEIYEKFSIPGAGEGLGQSLYDAKSNYVDDAFACWRGFNRTTDPGHCDYRKDSKKILPDTKTERRELGLDPKDRPNTFLCDFCPVHSIVEQKARKKAGLYE